MNANEKKWIEYGKQHLVGRKIKSVRYLTDKERLNLNWSCRPLVIVLDNGTLIYPSRDDEGNDGGALFGQAGKEDLVFPVL